MESLITRTVSPLKVSRLRNRSRGRRTGDERRKHQTLVMLWHRRRPTDLEWITSQARLHRWRAMGAGHRHRHHGTAEAQRQRQHNSNFRAGRRRPHPRPAQVLRFLGILQKGQRGLTMEIVWRSDGSVPAPRVEWRGTWHLFDATTLKYGCRIDVHDHCRDSVTRSC